jgi:hypothetical protein
MKPALKNTIYILIFTCITLSSCMNEYESQAIGYYEVDKFEVLDSTKLEELPSLLLNDDKTFVLKFRNKKVYGKWIADDYGDFTVIDFSFDNRNVQGELFGQMFEKMEILNPLDFYIKAKSFSFKRIENLSH